MATDVLAHALSGAIGSATATSILYPLELVAARLKVQRKLQRDGAISTSDQHSGVVSSLEEITRREGGVSALYSGFGQEILKTVSDSFLFFLFYNHLREVRARGNRAHVGHSSVLEELLLGVIAGACSRALTTPIANVVTRKQTSNLMKNEEPGGGGTTTSEILADIKDERGLVGYWAGYSASLILTLNPSLTFLLQNRLSSKIQSRKAGQDPRITFISAASSKAVATAITYPIQNAKTRLQLQAPTSNSNGGDRSRGTTGSPTASNYTDAREKRVSAQSSSVPDGTARRTLFAVLRETIQADGLLALYDGILADLLKGFLTHGLIMLTKDTIHKLVSRMLVSMLVLLRLRRLRWRA